MNSIHTILVATDFSALAHNAVRRAAMLASEHDARLRILHVIDPSGDYCAGNRFSVAIDPTLRATQARLELRRTAEELSQSLDVQADLVVKIGDELDMLVRESRRASLVVIAQRAGASIKELLLGTRAGRLLDACARPVLVVRQSAKGPYRHVLTGFDFTTTSDEAAVISAALAPAAGLKIMHVVCSKQNDVLSRPELPDAIENKLRARQDAGVVARMQRRLAMIGFDSRELRFSVGRGPSAATLLSQGQAQGADVVAVGRQRRSKWLDALLGSVSRRVLERSRSDVLVVPSSTRSAEGSGAVAAGRLAGGRIDRPTLAPRGWTIEADPSNTGPPAWSTSEGGWRGNPIGAVSR